MERKTPLYDRHTAAGGKLVPFAGWLLPVQYSGVIAEHRAVRTGCGLFDVSHMGELLLRGPDALANLNRLMTNDFSGMADGQARYSPMCYEDGGVVDDLIVYRYSDTAWLAVVNASNTAKDRDWMTAHLAGDCTLEDLSDQTAQLALQGPGAEVLLRTLTADLPAKNYTAVLHGTVDGRPCLVSRTGYTGEDGFELYCAPADAPALWDALTAAGALPCGLGARDTLRLEAAMPLYGHELSLHQPLRGGAGHLRQAGEARLHRQGRPGAGPPRVPPPGGSPNDRARHRPGGLPGVRRRAAGGRGHLRHPLPLGGAGGGPGPGGRGVQGAGHPAPGGRAGAPGGRPGGQNALLPAGIRANRPRRLPPLFSSFYKNNLKLYRRLSP